MTIIATYRDLVKLHHRLHKFSVRDWKEEYNFQLAGFSAEENERLGILLNSYSKECGCNAGSFIMSMSSIGSITYYFISGGTLAAAGLHHWLWLAAFAAAGALMGKLIGVLHARWKMIRLINNAISLNSRSINQLQYQNLQEKPSWEESAAKPRNG